MQIRPFQIGDEPALWEVFRSAIYGTAAADYTPEQIAAWAPVPPDAERWAERMRGIQPFVAEQDDQIIGYADVQDDGYIDHFFVASDRARQGVGSLLMKHIHTTAMARGIAQLSSDVSITARPFFEKWGFVVLEPQSITVRGVTMTNYRMLKPLGAIPSAHDRVAEGHCPPS
jgi:putative acetyltransferase